LNTNITKLLKKVRNVLKFGGTSVGSAENIKKVSKIVENPDVKLVVLSAMSGTTDILVKIEAAAKANKKTEIVSNIEFLKSKYLTCIGDLLKDKKSATDYINDTLEQISTISTNGFSDGEIQARGELMTTFIFTEYLKETGRKAELLFSPDYMFTDKSGTVIQEKLSAMKDATSDKDTIYVAQGFICTTSANKLGTLGRGGSDYSAALMGVAIEADEVQIWTDIDGMHTGDPRYVKGTHPIRMMSFEEAAEMAYFGAKILHPATIDPCRRAGIPVILKNTMDPAAEGTTIGDEDQSATTFHAVAAKDEITLIRISSARMLMAYGFLCKVFEIFEKWKTPIDMITTSEVAVSLTIDNSLHLSEIKAELEELGTVEIEHRNSIVCIVGRMDYDHSGISARIFKAVENIPVKMISYGASHHSISLLIDTKYKVATLQSLNNNLF